MDQIKNLVALFVMVSIFMTACDKEAIINEEDIITQNGWVLTSLIMNDEDGSYEAVHDMEACELDDIVFFKKEDNQFAKDHGPKKCYEEEDQYQVLGYWAIIAGGDKLAIGVDGEEVVNMDILEISAGHLVLHWEESPEDDTLETCTMTLKAAN